MLDEEEWAWIVEMATGDFDHLLFGTSLPLPPRPRTSPPGSRQRGRLRRRLGPPRARIGESVRQLVDLEHWPAFHKSFTDLSTPATLRRLGRALERRPSRLGNGPLRRRTPRLPGEDGLRRRRQDPRLPVDKLPPAKPARPPRTPRHALRVDGRGRRVGEALLDWPASRNQKSAGTSCTKRPGSTTTSPVSRSGAAKPF